MRCLLSSILFTLLMTSLVSASPEDQVGRVLDDFHKAASEADGERYFGHFTEDAVFLGTDIDERWSVTEFKAYAEPHFSQGRGWTYHPVSRNIDLAPDEQTAWFDEILANDKYGSTRGSGVLILEDGVWKVAQYHLTVPIPNALLQRVVDLIQAPAGER